MLLNLFIAFFILFSISVNKCRDGCIPWQTAKRFFSYLNTKPKTNNPATSLWVCQTLSAEKGSTISIELLAFPTSCSLWKTTTLPPLSPVANSSPVELNSTVEIMSAGTQEAEQSEGGNVSVDRSNQTCRKRERERKKAYRGDLEEGFLEYISGENWEKGILVTNPQRTI